MLAIGALLWSGCSPEDRYQTLSFFFDGVPDPNAPVIDGAPTLDGQRVQVTHKPFQDEQCLECHPNPASMLLTRDDGSICLKCHEGVPTEHPVMHGSVTSLACIWCHNPHMSVYPSLLRDKAPGLCVQCHDEQSESTMAPPHPGLESDCLSCHHGHGGDAPYFLRDGAATLPVDGAPDGAEKEADEESVKSGAEAR